MTDHADHAGSGGSGRVPVSAIVPALNEASTIRATLDSLAPLRALGGEVIVVDGGSRDGTVECAGPAADRVLAGPRGRARQMNAGAAAAHGETLWFVHADTLVDGAAIDALHAVLGSGDILWGRIGVRLDSPRPLLRLAARLMNIRSCMTGIATGDQGIFVRRRLFEAVGRFPDQPLMEDVEICRRLLAHARPCCLPVGLTTSARRWEDAGAWRTIGLMWWLRWKYWRGSNAAELATHYGEPTA